MKYKPVRKETNHIVSVYCFVFVCLLFFSFGILCGLARWEEEIVGEEVVISTKWTGRRWRIFKTRDKSAIKKNFLSGAQMKLDNIVMIDWCWNVLALNINSIPYASPPPRCVFWRLYHCIKMYNGLLTCAFQ